jgi:hypothetical protein
MSEHRIAAAEQSGELFIDDVRGWMAAVILLAKQGQLPNVRIGDDESSQRFAGEVRRLNTDWMPGQVPCLPPRPRQGLSTTERERLLRLRGAWAYLPSGELKADWLLKLGPKAWEKRQRRNMQAMRRDRAKHRLVSPEPRESGSRPRERRSRRRKVTARRTRAGATRDGPGSSESDDEPPPVASVRGFTATSERLSRHLQRRAAAGYLR